MRRVAAAALLAAAAACNAIIDAGNVPDGRTSDGPSTSGRDGRAEGGRDGGGSDVQGDRTTVSDAGFHPDVASHTDATSKQDGGHPPAEAGAGDTGGRDAVAGDGGCDPAQDPMNEPCVVDEAYGIFLAGGGIGNDDNSGTRTQPVATFARAIQLAAAATPTKRVYVCAPSGSGSEYVENVTLDSTSDGVSIFGGFACTGSTNAWVWSGLKPSLGAPTGSSPALTLTGLTQATEIEDLEIEGPVVPSGTGGSSIAVLVASSTNVTIRRVNATANAGASGGAATGGTTGANGTAGNPGTLSPDVGGDPVSCTCGGQTTTGGGGAADGTGLNQDGGPPLDGGSAGSVQNGYVGENGAGGAAGGAGSGAGMTGTLSATGWVPAPGHTGNTGGIGQGGGGGASNGNPGASGGGGCGGCPGGGGGGGPGGGSSFPVLSFSSTLALDGCLLTASAGGAGSSGAPGGMGGGGGDGGQGNGYGYAGGAGGAGGPGGPGGGGAGGNSVGVGYTPPAPTVTGTTTILIADAGAGGARLAGEPSSSAGVPGIAAKTSSL